MAATKTRKVIKKAIRHEQKDFAEIIDFRELDSGNIVLIFEDAEVVMPGGWRLSRDLLVGDMVVTYWDEDGKFHLEWPE